MSSPPAARVLYVVVCGAGPASALGVMIDEAHQAGWDIHIIATPSGLDFLDVADVELRSGHAVRSQYRQPNTPREVRPPAEAIIVAPATFNTINKIAAGISDNYALGVLAEGIGAGIPTVVLPFVNSALAARVPFEAAVTTLREEGVRVLLGPGGFEPHPPGSGAERVQVFPWAAALQAV